MTNEARKVFAMGRLRELDGPHAAGCASRARTPFNVLVGTWRDCSCGLLGEQATDHGRTWVRPLRVAS